MHQRTAHLWLGEVAQREQRARQLPLAQVRQKVRLILDCIRRECQPHILLLSAVLLLLLLLLLLGRLRDAFACRLRCRCCVRVSCCGAALQPSVVPRRHPVKSRTVLLL